MTKTEIDNATAQELIEVLMHNEKEMALRGGVKVKGFVIESIKIAKELSNRGLIDFDTFITHKELKLN